MVCLKMVSCTTTAFTTAVAAPAINRMPLPTLNECLHSSFHLFSIELFLKAALIHFI